MFKRVKNLTDLNFEGLRLNVKVPPIKLQYLVQSLSSVFGVSIKRELDWRNHCGYLVWRDKISREPIILGVTWKL